MRYFLTLVVLLVLQIDCQADYWNSDFQLPRLKGVKKILVKETRWDYASGKPQNAYVNRYVLWLNRDGLVIKEDIYEQYSHVTSYNTYEYIGNDTTIHTIRAFVHPGLQVSGRKSTKEDPFIHTVEFVNEVSDPQRSIWLVYQIDSLGSKRLLNSTSTYYNSNRQEVYSLYNSFETTRYTDSTVYLHIGDTLTSFKYTTDAGGAVGPYRLKQKEVVVNHRDSKNHVIYSERIADTYSGTLRTSHFIYDKNGRYLGERYKQECEQCKTGWLSGNNRRSYDVAARLRSIVCNIGGRPILQYDLVYVK